MPDAAAAGRLGEMRAALVRRARHERLVVCDDDLLFHRDFRRGLERFGDDFDALGVRVLNPDGTRYWDWCTVGGPRGHRLLDYEECDAGVYLSGAVCVLRREVARQVGWNTELGFYEGEDVDFSRRLVAAGYRIGFCPTASVVHDDVRYRQRDMSVRRYEGLGGWYHRAWGRLLRPRTASRGYVDPVWHRARLPVHDGPPRILVTGVAGAGTSELGRSIAALAALPFAPDPHGAPGPDQERKLAAYRSGGGDVGDLAAALTRSVARACHVRRPERFDLGRLRLGRRTGCVIRDVAAPLSAAALSTVTELRVVVAVRHPGDLLRARGAAAAEGAGARVAALLEQPRLLEEHLGRYTGPLGAVLDDFRAFGAWWGAVHHVLLRQAERRRWLVLRHEDLRSAPEATLRAVLAYAGEQPRKSAWRFVQREADGSRARERQASLPPAAWQACVDGARIFPDFARLYGVVGT